jgi:Helix-turn-helix domain
MTQTTATVNRRYYIANVSPALWQHAELSLTAKAVATTLLMHHNTESKLCYMTEEVVATELGISKRTVIRAIAELRDARLISVQPRSAPRGNAKGRANSYDLTGLLNLCEKPIVPVREIEARKPRREVTKTTRIQKREVTKTTPREVTKTTPHASDFHPITDNSNLSVLDSTSASHGRSLAEDEDRTVAGSAVGDQTKESGEVTKTTPHSSRTAMLGPLAGLTAEDIRQKLLAPDGTRASQVCTEADGYDYAKLVVEHAGGEKFNPGDLSKLCDNYGADFVWFHAKWLLRRIASMKDPVRKPTAFFIDCVRDDYSVDPNWPDIEEVLFESYVAQHSGRREQLLAMPQDAFDDELAFLTWKTADSDNYEDPLVWIHDSDKLDLMNDCKAEREGQSSDRVPEHETVTQRAALYSVRSEPQPSFDELEIPY